MAALDSPSESVTITPFYYQKSLAICLKGPAMHRFAGILCVLAMPILLAAGQDDVRKELKALQGKWKTVSLEFGGKELPKDKVIDFTIVLDADGKATGKSPKGEFRFTITVDPKKSPKTIVNNHETGDQAGKKQYGIYKLEGNRWTVCTTGPGADESDRPKDFKTADTKFVVFVFERVQEIK